MWSHFFPARLLWLADAERVVAEYGSVKAILPLAAILFDQLRMVALQYLHVRASRLEPSQGVPEEQGRGVERGGTRRHSVP